jgi:hypothetical protein
MLSLVLQVREKSTVTKPPEPMEEDHEGGQDPHRVVAPVKMKNVLRPRVLSISFLSLWFI